MYHLYMAFGLFVQKVNNSRVCQRGTEMLSNVGLQDGVKVLELSVRYEPNYEDLSENREISIRMGTASLIMESATKMPFLLKMQRLGN